MTHLVVTPRSHGSMHGDLNRRRLSCAWIAVLLVLTTVAGGGCADLRSGSDAGIEESRAAAHCPGADLPQRIILNLTDTPAISQAVTWRTRRHGIEPRAQIAPASGSARFDDHPAQVNARSQAVNLDDGRVIFQHAVVFDGLRADTQYAYRVGADGVWSEWNQFKTAASGPEPFSFVYFGDPQEKIRSTCSRVFRAAYKKAPEAAFWHFVGDLVDNGDRDEQWGELFDAMGWIPRTTPAIMLPGNHAYPNRRMVEEADYHLFGLWRPHFTLPENGPAGLEETVYAIDYQGVRLVMLNGNERLREQARWLAQVLSANPQRWTIVAIHQPVYSTGKYRGEPTLQDLFVPIFDEHGVDLVLQGHDHTYSRSARLKNSTRDDDGTVYVVSVCGPKSYPLNPRHQDLMAVSGTGRQLFQVIRVTPTRLRYESYDAAGTRRDAFTLHRH